MDSTQDDQSTNHVSPGLMTSRRRLSPDWENAKLDDDDIKTLELLQKAKILDDKAKELGKETKYFRLRILQKDPAETDKDAFDQAEIDRELEDILSSQTNEIYFKTPRCRMGRRRSEPQDTLRVQERLFPDKSPRPTPTPSFLVGGGRTGRRGSIPAPPQQKSSSSSAVDQCKQAVARTGGGIPPMRSGRRGSIDVGSLLNHRDRLHHLTGAHTHAHPSTESLSNISSTVTTPDESPRLGGWKRATLKKDPPSIPTGGLTGGAGGRRASLGILPLYKVPREEQTMGFSTTPNPPPVSNGPPLNNCSSGSERTHPRSARWCSSSSSVIQQQRPPQLDMTSYEELKDCRYLRIPSNTSDE